MGRDRLALPQLGQYLRVTAGVARFGGRDGSIILVHSGQTTTWAEHITDAEYNGS